MPGFLGHNPLSFFPIIFAGFSPTGPVTYLTLLGSTWLLLPSLSHFEGDPTETHTMHTCNFKAQQNPCLASQSEKDFPLRMVRAFDWHVHHSSRAQPFLLGTVIFPCPLWKVSSRRAGPFYHSTSTWHAGGPRLQVVSSIKCKKNLHFFLTGMLSASHEMIYVTALLEMCYTNTFIILFLYPSTMPHI